MLVHPQFNPVALSLGPVQIHWYGLTYLVAFALFLWLARQRVQRADFVAAGWTRRDVEDILFYGVLGVVIERVFLKRLYGLDPLYGLLLTFGLSLIFEGIFRELYGVSGQSYPVQGQRCRRQLITVNGSNDQHAQAGVVRLDVADPDGAALDTARCAGLQLR